MRKRKYFSRKITCYEYLKTKINLKHIFIEVIDMKNTL